LIAARVVYSSNTIMENKDPVKSPFLEPEVTTTYKGDRVLTMNEAQLLDTIQNHFKAREMIMILFKDGPGGGVDITVRMKKDTPTLLIDAVIEALKKVKENYNDNH
jgi:hypothetical protein